MEPRHANIEQLASGEWKVWRTFRSLSAAMAAVSRLCEVEPAGFDPAPKPPVVPHNVAAEILRDRVLASDDDTREPPRCATGACDGE
jgi:hypothetical protein